MYVVLTEDNFFVSRLDMVTPEDLLRPDVIETPDRSDLTSAFQYVNNEWVAPEPPPRDPEAGPPRN
jgi:hypothetical protein